MIKVNLKFCLTPGLPDGLACVYLSREVLDVAGTTLRQLGITSGNSLIRFAFAEPFTPPFAVLQYSYGSLIARRSDTVAPVSQAATSASLSVPSATLAPSAPAPAADTADPSAQSRHSIQAQPPMPAQAIAEPPATTTVHTAPATAPAPAIAPAQPSVPVTEPSPVARGPLASIFTNTAAPSTASVEAWDWDAARVRFLPHLVTLSPG